MKNITFSDLKKLLNCTLEKNCNEIILVNSPPFSGKSYFAEFFNKITSNLSHKFCISTDTDIILNENEFCYLISEKFKREYGNEINIESHGSSSSFISSLLQPKFRNSYDSFILFIDSVNNPDNEQIYRIFSRLRSIREVNNSNPSNINFVAIFFGTWIHSSIDDKHKEKGSSPLDEPYCMLNLNYEEIKILGQDSGIDKLKDLHIKYIKEITNGCYAIVKYIIDNINQEKITCDEIYKICINYSKENYFKESVQKVLDEMPKDSLQILNTLLKGRFVKYDSNDIKLQKLLLSGLTAKSILNNIEILKINSWVHEYTLRKNNIYRDIFLKAIDDNDIYYSTVNELIIPTPTINDYAYSYVLEIENQLKNLIIFKFHEKNENKNDHPLSLANSLGIVKNGFIEGSVYETCKIQRNLSIGKHNQFNDSKSSLNTFLNPQVIINVISENSTIGFYEYFKDIFPDQILLKKNLKKWQSIRNMVAHNNIISESTLIELEEVKDNLFKSFILTE